MVLLQPLCSLTIGAMADDGDRFIEPVSDLGVRLIAVRTSHSESPPLTSSFSQPRPFQLKTKLQFYKEFQIKGSDCPLSDMEETADIKKLYNIWGSHKLCCRQH